MVHSFLLYRSPHTFAVRPLIVSIILWLLIYSQLPWYISLSDLHCHGILYRDSPTTSIIFTLISNLFSTAMAYSLVIFLTSTVMVYSTTIQLYMLRWSLRYLNCHGTWLLVPLLSLCFFHNLCILFSPHPQIFFNFDLSKFILSFFF